MALSSQKESKIEVIVNIPDILERDPTGQFIRFNNVIGIETSKKVYEGLDAYNDVKIAWSKIKVGQIGEAGLKKCCQEAELWKSLNHEHILKCYTYWYDGINTINVITDLFTSGNLRDYILEHDLVHSTAVIKDWCRQILSALHYLHSQYIIHLDVNVDNIVVDEDSGTVKLADFGVAVYKEPSNVCNTTAGAPEYRAPEIFSCKFNHLADIHSFGMTVLQMVSCEKIYSEYKLADIDDAVQSGVMPVALGEVYDPQLKKFIKRCVSPASERPAASVLLKEPFLATTDEDDRVQERPKPSVVEAEKFCIFWCICWFLMTSFFRILMGPEWEIVMYPFYMDFKRRY